MSFLMGNFFQDFIKDYPVFSIIAVPVLVFVLIIALLLLIKPRNKMRDSFPKLYDALCYTLYVINTGTGSERKKYIGAIKKSLSRVKYYYEYLESEELYEIEGIIKNISKADDILKAVKGLKLSGEELQQYLAVAAAELEAARRLMQNFNAGRKDKPELGSFDYLRGKKSKAKFREYLDSLDRPE